MTQEKTKERVVDDINEDETEKVDFETLLLRRNAKQTLENSEWSEVIIDDVQIYSGYEFADAEMVRDTETDKPIRGTISPEGHPKDILESLDTGTQDEYTTKRPKFRKTDGSFTYNGREVIYRNRKWIVVTITSRDGSYSENLIITRTPKFESNTLDTVYSSIVEDIGEQGSLGSPPDSSKRYLRTDQVLDSNHADMVVNSFMRMGIMGTALLGGTLAAISIMALTGSLMLGSLFMGGLVLVASMLQQSIYDGWYQVVKPSWIEELPEDAKITAEVTENMNVNDEQYDESHFDFTRADAEVKSYDDGTVVLDSSFGTWTFEGEQNGVPSDQALELYKAYGGLDLDKKDSIPIFISENDERIPLKKNEFRSDDGEWVLKFDSL